MIFCLHCPVMWILNLSGVLCPHSVLVWIPKNNPDSWMGSWCEDRVPWTPDLSLMWYSWNFLGTSLQRNSCVMTRHCPIFFMTCLVQATHKMDCVICFSCKGLSCEGFPWMCFHTYVLSDQPWIDSYQWSTFQAPFLQFSNIVRVMFWLGQFVPLPQNAFMCLSMKHIPSSIRAIQQYCPHNVLSGPPCPTAPIPSRQNVLNCCVRDLGNFLSAHFIFIDHMSSVLFVFF